MKAEAAQYYVNKDSSTSQSESALLRHCDISLW